MDLSWALFVIRSSVKLLRLGFANYENTRFGLRVCNMRLIGCVSKILTAALGKLAHISGVLSSIPHVSLR